MSSTGQVLNTEQLEQLLPHIQSIDCFAKHSSKFKIISEGAHSYIAILDANWVQLQTIRKICEKTIGKELMIEDTCPKSRGRRYQVLHFNTDSYSSPMGLKVIFHACKEFKNFQAVMDCLESNREELIGEHQKKSIPREHFLCALSIALSGLLYCTGTSRFQT